MNHLIKQVKASTAEINWLKARAPDSDALARRRMSNFLASLLLMGILFDELEQYDCNASRAKRNLFRLI